MANVHDEQGIGQVLHVLDASQAAFQFVAFARKLQHFLLDQVLDAAVFLHAFELLQALDGGADRAVVGQHPAQPAVGYVGHAATLGFFLDRGTGRPLGSDEHDGAAPGCELADEAHRVDQHRQRFLEVDDVDLAACSENVGSHLGIPVSGLVTEVHAGFEHLAHGDVCHW